MPNLNKPSQESLTDLPDKEYLYSEFTEPIRRLARFADKVRHKALDIPMDDDMHNVGNRYGLGWKEMAVAGGLGLGMYGIATREPPVVPPLPAPAVAADHQDLDTTRSVVIKPRRPSE